MANPTMNQGPISSANTTSGLGPFRPRYMRAYNLSTFAFLSSLTLLLLALVEIRRGFLFPFSDYLRIGAPTTILYLALPQIPLLVMGGLGVWLSYRRMAAVEKNVGVSGLNHATTRVAVVIFVLLVVDLFVYRGVPAYRIVTTGKLSVAQSMPATAFPAWAQPLQVGLNYLALVWHATLLAILLGALFLTLTAGRLMSWLSGQGFKAHITGAALAVPQPFCSCCSAPIGATIYQQGASLGATLSFIVSSPMLNISGLILAVTVLPWKFAALRLLGGLFISVFATYAVSLVASRWIVRGQTTNKPDAQASWWARTLERYARLFDFHGQLSAQSAYSPAALIANWLTAAWRLGRVIVPVVLVGSVVTAAVVQLIPSPQNDMWGVVAAAILGTLVMVPTWTELPVASLLINQGLTAPAATLLVTLPAISIPSLAVISGAVASLRVSILLGLAVFATGVLAGVVFLAL